ncbi:hypothetical protein [Bacillus thuringiensis]|uniref:hypothetical protein n=1 Tax=Bacillus thuringiensis TaxID=1428 RepID=UPI001C3F4235|nr:hypothetical protein [Bacillus thuringiensis]
MGLFKKVRNDDFYKLIEGFPELNGMLELLSEEDGLLCVRGCNMVLVQRMTEIT